MTEHVDTVLLEDEFLEAAIELRDIAAQKKKLAEREAEAKRIIEKVLSVGDRGVAQDGTALIAVRKGAARFKAELAAERLPQQALDSITILVADGARAKAVLPPALYELCCEDNKPSVVAL